jgi:hypothetical protein
MAAACFATALVSSMTAPTGAAAQENFGCAGDLPSNTDPQSRGSLLRFGVTPSGAAGQIGPLPSPFEPDRTDKILEAIGRLRYRRELVLHLYTAFRAADKPGDNPDLAGLVDLYTRQGYPVEIVLRYRPDKEGGDVPGYVRFVRHAVQQFGRNPKVVAIQVTNEVNLTFSPDSSDGAYPGARDALLQGVIGASHEAARRRFRQIEIGFNWFYRTDPSNERSLWEYIRDRGGAPFRAALDWVGLDAYPGTFFPPTTTPLAPRDAIVNALSTLRECYMDLAGIADSVPIHVTENGFPTGPGRSYADQARLLEEMVRAVHDYRGNYNVTDYRWFNLRDADTESPNFQQQYGLMTDVYADKPAFGVYHRLIGRLGASRRSSGG